MSFGLIERYGARLPVTPGAPVVSLGEGGTPLIPAARLEASWGLPAGSLWLKFEGTNPTGSFKDRGMTVAVSKALEAGSRGVLCASTGNTAASAAAYAARAGLKCVVLLPAGAVALGKLAQALMHGARVVAVHGGFDEALELALGAAPGAGLTVVNSVNPHRIEGQKTAAFEVVEALGRAPDYQFMPVGNAGNITAYWKGYRELAAEPGPRAAGGAPGLPKMMGWQAAGADPIVRGRPVAKPRTVATAIKIGNPASWKGAVAARDESGGVIDRVTDAEILKAWKELAAVEGVFCEPASAAGAAGLAKLARRGFFEAAARETRAAGRELKVVCVLTGHGLKDPEAPARLKVKFKTVAAELGAIRRALR